ncbi:dihydroxyacetone kinase subunit DhaL [Kitasatospora viridis]|uniref:Dihydroxyacetone kinase-like protein n=1 Tax=Kitasatospora viridis TaxID=281105 RepID=A0A561UDU6_9ACTN|nr:dihydroxyacetone kinase subunit DhaL [Kitasatospora viridis]TWF97542.1 dihydroxyacetone kinase-like protein [Kitasatospora viridis]
MPYAMDHDLAEAWLRAAAAAVEQREEELTALDGAIGDGDHGSNLRRGFTAVTELLDGLEPGLPPGTLLTRAGSTLISKVGGAAGPLYGSALRAAGSALPEPTADLTDLAAGLRAGLSQVCKLGGAQVGDKTMVDAFEPAVAALERAAFDGFTLREASALAAEAAEAGARSTVPLVARKGRASYLGPRSAGHQDPGATSTALLFAALARVAG